MVRVIAGYILDAHRLIASRVCRLRPRIPRRHARLLRRLPRLDQLAQRAPRVPQPNCFLEGDDDWFLAFVTRSSPERPAPDVTLHESPADREIRDRFIAGTGNKLDAASMQFMNRPRGIFRYPFVVAGA